VHNCLAVVENLVEVSNRIMKGMCMWLLQASMCRPRRAQRLTAW
jgi:hypothetical protein